MALTPTLPRLHRRWLPTMATSATLLGWYEARTDTVTLVSGNASRVANLVAGGANPLIQPTVAGQPPVETGSWGGGHMSLLFNGTTSIMTANGLAASVTGTDQPFSIVLVGQIVTLGSSVVSRTIVGFANSAVLAPFHDLRLPASTTDTMGSYRRDDASTGKFKNAATTITTARNTFGWVFNGTKVALWIGGALDANLDGVNATTADNNVGATTMDTFAVGGLARVTNDFQTNLRFGGMLVYAGALNDTDRQRAEQFLKQGHPL